MDGVEILVSNKSKIELDCPYKKSTFPSGLFILIEILVLNKSKIEPDCPYLLAD